jgi:hypothetical protein
MFKILTPIIIAGVLALAALTKPSRAELQAAAANYADTSSLVNSVAAHVTGVFGNDEFDDYVVFDRYRVYVGQNPRVDCFGAFGGTSCSNRVR